MIIRPRSAVPLNLVDIPRLVEHDLVPGISGTEFGHRVLGQTVIRGTHSQCLSLVDPLVDRHLTKRKHKIRAVLNDRNYIFDEYRNLDSPTQSGPTRS